MFSRRILHHGPDPEATPLLLSDRAVAGCWFELHRQGGCGAGEIVLRSEFADRGDVAIGDWISCETEPGDRWYLGRVEERRAGSPAEVRLRLEGMGVELNEVFPGGFGPEADGRPPHRFAATDLFVNDPDRGIETFDSVESAEEVVRLLLTEYVAPGTNIQHVPVRIEDAFHPASVGSIKFRGEESARSIIKELALRAQASWGVDAAGEFFFLQPRAATLATWREGRDITSLVETTDREHLFNRVLLTGDYVYDVLDSSSQIARRSYRWRGNYVQPESRSVYGERRIRLWVPWLRTAEDSLAFVREFFREYSQPTSRYLIETTGRTSLPLPWAGRIRIEDRDGSLLVVARLETLRVSFDHVPRFRLELGPEDPRDMWPEPPHDERWELPEGIPPGGDVSLSSLPPLSSSDGGGTDSGGGSSDDSDESPTPSDVPSDGSSGLHSDDSDGSDQGSEETDEGSEETGGDSEPAGSDNPSDEETGRSLGDSATDPSSNESDESADSDGSDHGESTDGGGDSDIGPPTSGDDGDSLDSAGSGASDGSMGS